MPCKAAAYTSISSCDDVYQRNTSRCIFKASVALISGSCLVVFGAIAVSSSRPMPFSASVLDFMNLLAIPISLQKLNPALLRRMRSSAATRANTKSFYGEFVKTDRESANKLNSFGDIYGVAEKRSKPRSFSGELLKDEEENINRWNSHGDIYGALQAYDPQQRMFMDRREAYGQGLGGVERRVSQGRKLPEQWTSMERREVPFFERMPTRGPLERQAGFLETRSPEIVIQGGALKTWTYRPAVERVQVVLKTDGRPMDADVDLWVGPDNVPLTMRVYVENGEYRPFSTVLETPRGPNTIAIRNVGRMEFPITAQVDAVPHDGPLLTIDKKQTRIQGGALKTYSFAPNIDSVELLLETGGRPLMARIELLQGPTNNKQVIEVHSENGLDRPFYAVLQTPGDGHVVRIVNTGPLEFPLYASMSEFTANFNYDSYRDMQPILQ